jgi:hypothetical protein
VATADDADFHKGFLKFVSFGRDQSYGKQLSMLQQQTKQPAEVTATQATAINKYIIYISKIINHKPEPMRPEGLKIPPEKP